jgi:hypothetical protein
VSLRARLAAVMAAALGVLGVSGQALAQAPTPTGAFETPSRPVWAGEVFDLSLAWRVNWATFQNLDGELGWKPDPLVADPWSAPSMRGTPADGWATIELKTRAMALQPGRVSLQPARQVMVVQTGIVDMDEYQRAVTGPVTVRSALGTLTVRPLPPAPAGFSGAVGHFTVTSSVDKRDLKVGDSLTWTVVVAGTGNWPVIRGLPPRQASRDFEVVGQPKLVEDKGATLFDRSVREEVVLIPQRHGRYVLGAFEMVVFDPALGRYVTLTAPPVELTINPGPNGDLAPEPEAAPADAKAEADALPPMLKGEGAAVAPPPQSVWIGGLALAPLALAAFWLLLALHRAWSLDPDRAARAAHARLRRTLAALARDPGMAARRRLVRAWQRDAAIRWKLGLAAPVPAAFGDRADWSRLWAEAERFLYGRSGLLPEDWLATADRLFADMGEPPRFAPGETFKIANLLPAACVAIVVVACIAPTDTAAASQVTEAALRQSLANHPLDWRARHNLAVTLAARDRWDEAAGQAAIAWLHQPRAPQTQALWLKAAAKAGYSLDPRSGVPRPRGWWGQVIALASPAAWRWIALAFAWMCALGLAAALLARYRPDWRRLRPAGFGLAAVSGCGGAVAAAALYAYGALASPDAVLVWKAGPLRPLPVDTPAESAPVQLAAGAAGRVDKVFLGWRRVRFDDARTGWIRREDLVQVWPATGQ